MKKVLFVFSFCILLQFSALAQFMRFGGKVGFGPAYVSDDLLTHSPVFGFSLGGYVDYMFTEMKNPWAENIYLQFGLNINRRGVNLQQVFVDMKSIRQAYYHNYYVQIPVLIGFKYEIPQLPAENFVSFYLGPTFSVGVWGRLWDRQVTPGSPQTSINYDTYVTGSKDDRSSFKNMRRIDAGIILGVGYQWHNFTFDLYMDHGFVSLMKEADVLINLENQTSENHSQSDRNAYLGTNQAFMLSVGYQLPFAN